MNNNIIKSLFLLGLFAYIVGLSSCVTRKEIVYFQDSGKDTSFVVSHTNTVIYRSGDIVTIAVSALDIEAVKPFNMPVVSFNAANGKNSGSQRIQDYLIDIDGYIDFPVLGKMKIANLDRIRVTKKIQDKLSIYVKNPIVNIRLVNFKITILGEVNSPGVYNVQNERITIPEALGLAGDLKLSGKRDNILVIREVEGNLKKYRIDLTTDELFNSPVYYLSQNDQLYVEAKKSVIRDSSFGKSTSIAFSVVSILLQLGLFVWQVTK